MYVVGLTGGIASGKSFIIRYLKKLKFRTHESDMIVGLLYKKPSHKFINFLNKIGLEKTIKEKKINKKLIQKEIFSNKDKRKKLEKYLHNEVKKKRDEFIKRNKKSKIIFIEVPLLFEKKLESEFNFIGSTIAALEIRERRALQRSGMNKTIFKQIVKNQVKDLTRRAKSDFIIDTSKTKKQTFLQVDKLVYDIINCKK